MLTSGAYIVQIYWIQQEMYSKLHNPLEVSGIKTQSDP